VRKTAVQDGPQASAARSYPGRLLFQKGSHFVKNPILLTELSALLRAETGHPGPGWRKLNEMACSAVIPAAKNGRNWAVERADLPEVIQILGLSPSQTTA
jgi:hypothetical protein